MKHTFFNKGQIADAEKLLQSDYDGSYTNTISRKRARCLLQAWATRLADFAQLSDTNASWYCEKEAQRLGEIVIWSEVEEKQYTATKKG